jgi:hypothetical protein
MPPSLSPSTLDDRLRRWATVCMALAGSVGLYALLIYLLVERSGEHDWMDKPATGAFLLALAGMLLVFLSSAARASVLRRAVDGEDEREDGDQDLKDGKDPRDGRDKAERLVAAFGKATLLSFALIEAGAVLGLAGALVSRISLYGLLICAASLFAMIVRWPRRSLLDAFLEESGAGGRP